MTDTTAQSEQTPTEAPKQTLEDLYAQYEAPKAAPEPPKAAPPAEPQATPESIAAIQRKMAELERAQKESQARDQAKKDEADLNKAVAALAKASDLKGKEKMLKGYLVTAATDDPRLLKLWQSRYERPEAWDKAVEILADDVKKEFEVPNPQLEENQRAMDESQRSSSSTAPAQKTVEHDIMKMNDGQFEHYWANLSRRGY